ncbi:MFS transporter [Burkholderia sp. Ac-20353]|uniref:MFS transporter n=1 Tax=Burkholderia sp. Ac-20353 TaxID=2703894 RepID=UPI00197C8590|nr:MFS transporter [Burkholderia sp. Ac-20353]MBN3786974.1 MFS transporter [Burkholderia sp. Ac-20353]
MNDIEAQESASADRTGRGAQIAAIVSACAGSAVFLGLPVVIGRLAQLRGLTPDQLGEVASAETLGVAFTAMFGSWFIRRFKPKQLMVAGLLLLAALQLLSAITWSYPVFIILRVGASLASGVVLPASVAVLSRSRAPERAFSWLVSSQIVLSAIELFAFGPVTHVLGMGSIYAALALICALALMLLVPASMPMLAEDEGASTQVRISPVTWVMVAAVFLFFCSIGTYWAFIERAGAQTGMTPDEVGGWLAASNVAALVGSVSAPWFCRRFGERAVLLFGSGMVALVPAGLLWGDSGHLGFLIDLGLFVVLWNLLMIVQMALLGRWDPTGRAVSLTPAAQGLGLALAPLGAGMVAARYGFIAAVASSSCFALACLVATWSALRRRAHEVALDFRMS